MRIVMLGAPGSGKGTQAKKLMNDKDVQEFYLGLNTEGTERKSFKDVKHYKRKKRWLS